MILIAPFPPLVVGRGRNDPLARLTAFPHLKQYGADMAQ